MYTSNTPGKKDVHKESPEFFQVRLMPGYKTTRVAGKQGCIVPLKQMEYGFGYVIIRSPYIPYSVYLRWTIGFRFWALLSEKGTGSVNLEI